VEYEFKCKNKECKTKIFSTFEPMDMKHKGFCPDCEKEGKRIFHSKPFIMDFTAGFDPGLGVHVNTARQRDTFVDKNNLRRIKA
jgi:hypothetical protein